MSSNLKLNPDELQQFLEADFENGLLYWKKRDCSMFSSQRSWSTWNSCFAGKFALNSLHPDGYKQGRLAGKMYLQHRVLLAMKLGHWPEYVDHINGNRMDNRICNLREVTKTENSCNQAMPYTNTSGHIGVTWNKRDKRWTAFIALNRKRKALGNFIEFADAVKCRKEAEIAYGFHPNHGRMQCIKSL